MGARNSLAYSKSEVVTAPDLKVGRWGYVLAGLIGFYFALQNLQIRTGDDAGIFVSISALVARGARLYVDVYETKEPLFYWLYGLAFMAGGIKGIAVAEFLLVVACAILCFRLLSVLAGSFLWAALTTVLFTGSLTGSFYAPIITSVPGLFTVMVVLNLLLKQRPLFYGAAIVFVCFSKLAFLPIVLGPTAVILIYESKFLRRVFEASIGAILALLSIISLLAVRGELFGYVEMVRDQARYKDVYPEVVGLPKGLAAPVQLLQSAMGLSVYLLLLLVQGLFLIRLGKANMMLRVQLFFLSIQIGAVGSIFLTGFWFHHLLPLSVLILGFAGFVAVELHKQTDISDSTKEFIDRTLSNVLAMGLCVVVAIGSGWDLSVHPRSNFAQELISEVEPPPSYKSLNQMSIGSQVGVRFSRLGPNDELGLAAFLPATWQLSCRFYGGQYGHESAEQERETIDCLTDNPEVLFISSGFFSLTRPAGDYDSFRAKLIEVVDRNFDCIDVPARAGSQICTRR